MCRSVGSSSTFSSAFCICSLAWSACSMRTTRRSPAIGAPAASSSQRRATATMLSPVERASRQLSGEPISRSGWTRARASRQPRQALQGRRAGSASVQKREGEEIVDERRLARPARAMHEERPGCPATVPGAQREPPRRWLANAEEAGRAPSRSSIGV